MRRWTMTFVLGAAAVAAAVLAPRLLAEVEATVTAPTTATAPIPEVSSQDGPGCELVPAQPKAVEVPQPQPELDDFWIDAVDCGLG